MRFRSIEDNLFTNKSKHITDIKSTNKMNKLIEGLNDIDSHPQLVDKILEKISQNIPQSSRGRQGMNLWSIFVLTVIRVSDNYSYPKLYDLVKNHIAIRKLLGFIFETEYYPESTLKDNLRLISPTLLEEINELIINYGHNKLTNYNVPELNCKTDSFVVLGNIEFPIDTNILYNIMEMLIGTINKAIIKFSLKLTILRQYKRFLKMLKRNIIAIFRSKSNKDKQKKHAKSFIESVNHYIKYTKIFIENNNLNDDIIQKLTQNIIDAELLCDQINRRIILDEKIPHQEKIFSIYKRYIEWISKGKVANPVELGLKVCLTQDQFGFLIKASVVENKSDSEMIVEYTKEMKLTYPKIQSNSMDKGFYSKENYEKLSEVIEEVVLPSRGYKNKEIVERESKDSFKEKRKQHAAIESAINGIEQSGLDLCRDYGINGFKRHVAAAVVARNIWKLGDFIINKIKRKMKRDKLLII